MTTTEPPIKASTPYFPDDDLPTLPDRTDVAELMDYMNRSATYYWQCDAMLRQLFSMTEAERRACPDYINRVNAARLGMSAARQLQEQASARLKALSAFPDSWKRWPERRAEPRLDIQ